MQWEDWSTDRSGPRADEQIRALRPVGFTEVDVVEKGPGMAVLVMIG